MMDDITPQRARELASKATIDVADWIELTGMGRGEQVFYVVDRGGVRFREWADDFIEHAPTGWQSEMCRQGTGQVLTFPCAPIAVVKFIENELGVFGLPDEFVDEVHRLQSPTAPVAVELNRLVEEIGQAKTIEPESTGAIADTAPPRSALGSTSNYLPKNAIVAIFGQHHKDAEWWRKTLKEKRNDLAKNCAHIPGRRGRGMQSQWNPLELAKWLLDNDEARQDGSLPGKVNREFRRNRVLEQWRTDWVAYWELYYLDY